MTVIYNQFQSEDGFKSIGFLVDEAGNFSIANLSVTGSLKVDSIEVLSTTTLASSVVNSSLTSLGTLRNLTVNALDTIDLVSAVNINLEALHTSINSTSVSVSTSGAIVMSSGVTGTIDNVNIGESSPGTGNFTTITATETVFIGSQDIRAYSAAMAVALS